MNNPIISIAMLREAGACAPELSRLESLFGSEITLTEDFALANAPLCDWDWAACNLLPVSAWAEYKRAYEHAKASTLAEYRRAKALIFARLFIASTREKTDQ